MSKLIYTLCASIFAFTAYSQIRGKILDEGKQPLPTANVVLYQGDNILSGTSTGLDGKFEINSPQQGSYRLEVSFIAYEKMVRVITVPATQKLDLGIIGLKPDKSSVLDEVNVIGEAKLFEFEQDKRVFNVAKDITSVGSNASEILNNLPSVAVDVEGNVSLRGSGNVRILINGKPSALIGGDPAAALRQLQGNLIEKIEVITNPSARYDAEGEAGIINIVLKKQDRAGLNGSFNLSAGNPHLYGAGATLNYRKNKLDFFTNLSFQYRQSPGGGKSDQSFSLPDTSYSFLRERDQIRGGANATIRFGADYQLSDAQTITGSFLFRPSRGNNTVDLNYRDIDANGNQVRLINRFDDETETESAYEGSINWQKTFKGNDKHKWTADFRYSLEDDKEKSTISQDTLGKTGELIQLVDNLEYQSSYLFQTDYIHPLGDKTSFELGSRATLRTIDNDYGLDQLLSDGQTVEDPDFNNRFRFIENVYAAYGIFNGVIGKSITYQLGLRGEITDLTTEVESDTVNQRNYANLFPSTFFTYKINPLSDIQLSYSRRISRPGFRTLAPFFGFSDNRNFYSGNPNVNPEFTDSYESGYVRYFENGSLYSGIYYRHRTGVIERITIVEQRNGEEFTRFFPINLAVQDAYGLEFNLQYKFAKWYDVNANVNLFQAVTVGDYEGIDFGAVNTSSTARLINKFSFWDSDLQITFNMRGANTSAQTRSLGIYTLDIGWSKDLLEGNGTLTLAVRDLFNNRIRRYYTSGSVNGGGSFNTFGTFQWRQRQITLNFTYRLNQKKGRPGGRSSNGGFEGGGDY
jgi:outer membrane receptor protein involved in Fe transport